MCLAVADHISEVPSQMFKRSELTIYCMYLNKLLSPISTIIKILQKGCILHNPILLVPSVDTVGCCCLAGWNF